MKKIIVLLILLLMISGIVTAKDIIAKAAEPQQPGTSTTAAAPKPGQKYFIDSEKNVYTTPNNKPEGSDREVPATVATAAKEYGGVAEVTGTAQTGYTYKFASQKKDDPGILWDYTHTTTREITVNNDGSYDETTVIQTDEQTGLVRGDVKTNANREEFVVRRDKDGKEISRTETVFEKTEIKDNTGKVTGYKQTPLYKRESTTMDDPTRKVKDSTGKEVPAQMTVERVLDNQGRVVFEARGDGTERNRNELARDARYDSLTKQTAATVAKNNLETAEQNLGEKNGALLAAKNKLGKGTPEEQQKAQKEYDAAKTEADKATKEYMDEKETAEKADAEAKTAIDKSTTAEEAALQPETKAEKEGSKKAKLDAEMKSARFKGFLKGVAGFGKFVKAYDSYSGLRQYSAIGLDWYDEKVQRRKAELQQGFCLNNGIENCVTSVVCGAVVPKFKSDNILVGRGPSGQYVSSGVINAERSIPIELEGMTRQQLIDLFGNTTVISGRLINLTDPQFDPRILGRIKVWQYHVQYTITNNQVERGMLNYNIKFNKAPPGSTTSYGTPVKDPKWYPQDKQLEYGLSGTDENLIWKYSATEYTDACLTFNPSLPSSGAAISKTVDKICAPFVEYQGGPTEVGVTPEAAAAAAAAGPAQQAGAMI